MANSPVLWGGSNSSIGLQNRFLMANGVSLDSNGPKNYITYCNFANLQTTGWSLGTTGTLTNGIPTGTPTFGSGASGNLSLSVTTTGTLQGLGSLLLTSSAATTPGNMLATQAYTIETADQAKVLTASFVYSIPTSPANGNFSGTNSNSFGIACYDVTNSSWLPVVGNFSMTQNSGAGNATVTMQTNATTASVRFVIYNANASAGAISLEFDRFFLGPQVSQIGPIVTDFQTFTGSITGTISGALNIGSGGGATQIMEYARNGSEILLRYRIQIGTTGTTDISGAYVLPVPSGVTLNQSQYDVLGFGDVTTTASAAPVARLISKYYSSGILLDNGDSTLLSSGGSLFTNNNVVTVFARAKVSGWSSNVQMSNDTDTRVVAFAAVPSTTMSVPNNTDTVVSFATSQIDTHGAWNGTNTYTVPVTGYYEVSCNYGALQNTNAIYNTTLSIRKNNIVVASSYFFQTYITTAVTTDQSLSKIISFKAGDTISISYLQDSGVAANGGQPVTSNLSINRLSGPAVIAANESVNARYTNSAGSAIGTSFAIVPLPTKIYDSHNSMNINGTYTVPMSGKYSVKVTMTLTPTSLSTTQQFQLAIYKNGSLYCNIDNIYGNGASNAYTCRGSDDIDCLAGDTLAIYAISSVGTILLTAAEYNHVAITRAGR